MEVQAFADDDIKTGEEKKKKKMKDKESPAVLQVIDSNQDTNRGDNGDAELVFGDDGEKKKRKKKKKKKKDKGMEMAESVPSFFPAPVSVNKKVVVPKHVREMREILSKRKEAEERKRREEEERLRKEEEERVNQEELDRLAQEKKRLKKEKLLKKKKEGKLLTGKQKEEARRLEAMRRQILAYANLDSSTAAAAPAKRIRYQTKKPKPQADVSYSNEIQQDVVPELDSVSVEGEGEGVESPSSHEEAVDDENWDAKSWDGVGDLKLQDFGDEEAASEPGPLPKKVAAVMPRKLESVSGPEVVVVKQDRSKPDDHGQNLRSPICCIMGHVDTGKTKLLDFIRRTNVQEGEAGGITQQIGATYFPAENIRERTKGLKADAKLNVPGLLVIDTPGHESFTNMRSRGSALCDIAVLVVDIMHGLEPQTIESLKLLKEEETDFIVALNKVDRLYGWKPCRDEPIKKAIGQQSEEVKKEFAMRITQVITQFKEQGFNTELYFKNKEMGETYNIVPTSAISGEGIPDLLLLLVKWAEKTMAKRLTFNEQVQCSVLVKVVEGHGTTIDVVLVNGVLHEGEKIVVGSLQGSIVTKIRALLTPHPMRELRVKGTYLHHKEIKAAQGIKIAAQGLEHAIAGTSLYVVGPHDDIEGIKKAAMEEVKSVTNDKVDKSGVKSVINKFDRSGVGVYVQASTDGSLDALLKFLKTPAVNIPFSDTSIGPVHKKDVRKASAMLEKKKEYATILAFDVEVAPEVWQHADELGVKIFTADIMYHLVDQFTAYIHNLKEEKKREAAEEAVFPCILQVIHVYRNKDPILLGVKVIDGIAKVRTPVCIFRREEPVDIGRIVSIQVNNKDIDSAKKGQEVAIKITGSRQLQINDKFISKISRRSLDVLKEHYRGEISSEEMLSLLFELKDKFKIQ